MKFTALVLSGVLLGSVSGAQSQTATPGATTQPGTAQRPESPSLVKIVDVVQLIFTVTDKHGRFVRDLKLEQFKILDNHRPPREFVNFESQTGLPLRVGLLIDASNSMRERFLFEQQATQHFLREIIHPLSDKAFVLAFDEIPELTQEFTNDLDKLAAGIRMIRPGGGTAMWDAVFYACREKMLKEKNSGPVRRVIVLVSDGDDNLSRVSPREAVEMAQRAEVIIYAVSTNLNNVKNKGDDNLEALADSTGGRAFFPLQLPDLSDAFKEIQGELRSQYLIVYKPDNFQPNGQFRTIQIIPDNEKLRVRARKGYFAFKP